MAVTAEQRRAIIEQAGDCCEYCRIAGDDRSINLEIDHIVSLKHGGEDESHNLCLACAPCNRSKGPNVAAIDPQTGEATKLFNPRRQKWTEHFHINPADASLAGLTPEGRATVLVLRMNDAARIEQRYGEALLGNYPCQSDR